MNEKTDLNDNQLITSLTISEIFGFIWRYLVSIIFCLAVPLIVAGLVIIKTPPTYTARVQMLLDPRSPQPIQRVLRRSSEALESPYVESQIRVLRSRKIALTVIGELKLLNDPELTGDLTKDGKKPPKQYVMTQTAIYRLRKNLDVRRSGMSYAIDIRYSSTDPNKAARIANRFALAYKDDQFQARADAIKRGSEWLETRIDELRRQMNLAALRVQKFRARRDYRFKLKAQDLKKREETNTTSRVRAQQQQNPEEGKLPVETLEGLESTAQTYRRIYESYLQAYTESLQRQSLPTTHVRIISLATAPLSPSAPKKTLIVALALLIGLLVGGGQAVLRHNL